MAEEGNLLILDRAEMTKKHSKYSHCTEKFT